MSNYRKRMPRKRSRRDFTRKARKVNRRNYQGRPMRGGIRL